MSVSSRMLFDTGNTSDNSGSDHTKNKGTYALPSHSTLICEVKVKLKVRGQSNSGCSGARETL